jgi:sigma-B regulation protein RsbU (phosphoserine phosphatase)
MGAADSATILLCTANVGAAADVIGPLEANGYAVRRSSFAEAAEGEFTSFQLIMVDSGQANEDALAVCRRLRLRLGNEPIPLLVVLGSAAPAGRAASLEAGADAHIVRPFLPAELRAQVQAFLRIHQLQRRLRDQTSEMCTIHQRLKAAYQQIDLELEAARRLQMSFLPQSLPETVGARFAVQYRPCGRVGGDFYDVFRLDENHVGFYIADAMGHGVPASLLTIFLKRGVRGKEITGKQYRLVPPAEVLGRLNRDLIEQRLPEVPFITMLYCLFNFREGTLRFARAGHPHPLFVPQAGEIQLWPGNGGLLGVFATEFHERTERLQPGDKLILYTDGLDTAQSDGPSKVAAAISACADKYRALRIDEYVARLTHDLLGQVRQADDFTLLGLEMTRAD